MKMLNKAADIIRGGGVVIVATETFYALGADPSCDDAVARIFSIKGRSPAKPLPLIASDIVVVLGNLRNPSVLTRCFAETFWPGSLTLVVQSNMPFAKGIEGPNGTIGVRVPPDCPSRYVASLAGGWLTATSANLSGEDPPDRVSAMPEVLSRAVDLVVDSGPTPGGLPSTIVEPLGQRYSILRQGVVGRDDIENVFQGCL
jgi:L-threonylcarbamoyladenylate synthase